ncbi:hypothetical protein SAMN05445756_1230 [Kytococcus aerolatus]|uniref:Uncharacterized protein n=2 Tax=Kytococcus aerolatus TaxID=592308 RepID=A0A212TG13_9MICO|nr:hypothetical protein SAMN05445756_1230 [Kytococcus aerolatus]
MRNTRKWMLAVPAALTLSGVPILQTASDLNAQTSAEGTFVTGSVISADGSIPQEATVTVNISPTQEELIRQAEAFTGTPLASRPMGVEGIPVKKDGSFSVSSADITTTPTSSGVHDVTVIAMDPQGGVSTHVTSMRWDATTKELTAVPMSDPREGNASVNEETGEVTRTPEATAAAAAAKAPAPGTARISGAADRDHALHLDMRLDGVKPQRTTPGDARTNAAGCGLELTSTWREPAIMGEVWSTAYGHETTVSLKSGSSSETEIAVKVGDAWKGGGTVNRELTSTFTAAPSEGPQQKLMKTWWTYGRYNYWSCKEGYVITRQVKAINRYGGHWNTKGSLPSAWHCARYQPGDSESIDRNRATRWSNGVDTSGAIGIDLAIRSGHSSTQTVNTAVKRSDTNGLRLCGLNTGPASDPRTWVVRG